MNHKKLDKSKLFWTAAPHYFHANIIKFCNRPFANAEEMRKGLIANWNSVVPEDGIVYLLGDFAHTGKIEWIKDTIRQLNGYKVLILGNHDYQNRFRRHGVMELFDEVHDVLNISVVDDEVAGGLQEIFNSHYPHIVWPNSSRGSWQAFAHCHFGPHSTGKEDGYVSSRLSPNQYDVGVDNNEYKPISYERLKEVITKQNLAKL